MGDVIRLVSTRDELLSGETFRTHEIMVGKKKFLLRELTAEEWMNLSKEERETARKNKEEGKEAEDTLDAHFERVSRLICQTAVTSEGKRIFQDGDEPTIRQKLGAATLMEVYRSLARLGQEQNTLGG